jgi:hypothetical protein
MSQKEIRDFKLDLVLWKKNFDYEKTIPFYSFRFILC